MDNDWAAAWEVPVMLAEKRSFFLSCIMIKDESQAFSPLIGDGLQIMVNIFDFQSIMESA